MSRGLGLLVSTLALLGCGTRSDAPEDAAAAAELQVLDSSGLVDRVESHRGTPLLLNFWATWCPPCVAELPDLAAVAGSEAGEGVTTLLVALDAISGPPAAPDEARAKVAAFLGERGIGLPTVVLSAADPRVLQERFRLGDGIPVTLAIGANGEIAEVHRGRATAAQFEELYGLARFEAR